MRWVGVLKLLITVVLILGILLPTSTAQIFVRQPDGSYVKLSFSHINKTAKIYWKNGTIYEQLGLEDLEVEDYKIYINGFKLNISYIGTLEELINELVNNRTIDENAVFINKQPTDRDAKIINSTLYPTSKAAAVFNSSKVSASKVDAIVSDTINFANTTKISIIINETSLTNGYKIAPLVDELLDRGAWTNLTAKNYIVGKDNDTAQAILYSPYLSYHNWIDIITFDAQDTSISLNTTFSNGVSIFDDLTIENTSADITVTIDTAPGVIIADTIYNNESIISGWVKSLGGIGGGGDGGNGTGGIIILARTITQTTYGSIKADGENAKAASGTGDGQDGENGYFWLISGHSVASGGAVWNSKAWVNAGKNGGGGGECSGFYLGGSGGVATTETFADAESLVRELIKAASDYWLINVLGKTPSTYIPFPELGGSGGGGGGTDGSNTGGGGGGGGGQIIIISESATIDGTISANGGGGGNAVGSLAGTRGGGGGGGIIYIFYKTYNGAATLSVSGGAPGSGGINRALSGGAGTAYNTTISIKW